MQIALIARGMPQSRTRPSFHHLGFEQKIGVHAASPLPIHSRTSLTSMRASQPERDVLADIKPADLRSALMDAKALQKTLLPWHRLFDKPQRPAKPQQFENDQLQPQWHNTIKDPGLTGPYKTHDYFIGLLPASTGRAINAQVIAPDPSQRIGPAPVILVSPPGFIGELPLPFQQKFYDIQPYIGFMAHFASMGFIAVGLFEHRSIVMESEVDHQRDAYELKSITDHLLGANSPLQDHFLPDQIAVMGHSKGGKMGFYQAAIDPRVKLVMAIDPVNQGGPPWFVSKKFADNPVAPVPGITPEGAPSLMDKVKAKAVILRAPSDFINFDDRFNARHFWDAFKGDGVYLDCKANHADWIKSEELRQVTRRVFTAALMDEFHPDKPFSKELRPWEIKAKTPGLIDNVQIKKAPAAIEAPVSLGQINHEEHNNV